MAESIWLVNGTDKNYEHYRLGGSEHSQNLRSWMDKAYFEEGLAQYLDLNFLDQLRNHDFFARLWELELAEWLWLSKLKLIPTNGSGPDFCIELSDGKKIWIEAILATPNQALDEKWRASIGKPGEAQVYDFPKDENAMRYGSALYTKAVKIKDSYIDKGKIGQDDLVLIAVSGFPPGALHPDIEHFIRAAFPVGDPVVHFSTNGDPIDTSGLPTHTDLTEYTKPNGAAVLKQFLYPGTHFPYIDGVLFTEASNLQQLLGVWSSRFDASTNVPHIFPNYGSSKQLSEEFTDNFYLHQFIINKNMMSLETIDPNKQPM